jgi:dolichol-phosphate mannosyltransferase
MHYFVVLAYNEEENLPQLFASIQCIAASLKLSYKVIVVDDGSTDRTLEIAEEFRKTLPIYVERHMTNLGVGEGFRTGFRSALSMSQDGDVIFTLEADNTGDLGLLPALLEKINQGADVSLASCYAKGGDVQGVSWTRKTMSKGINLVMRVLFPIRNCHTYSSFYRAYKSDILRQGSNRYGHQFITSNGFSVAAEILFRLRRVGAKMDEVPMVLHFNERKGKSKMKVTPTILEYLSFLSREMMEDVRLRYLSR